MPGGFDLLVELVGVVLLGKEHEGVQEWAAKHAAQDDTADHRFEVLGLSDGPDVDASNRVRGVGVLIETIQKKGEVFGLQLSYRLNRCGVRGRLLLASPTARGDELRE